MFHLKTRDGQELTTECIQPPRVKNEVKRRLKNTLAWLGETTRKDLRKGDVLL